jgi:hypothetical protein
LLPAHIPLFEHRNNIWWRVHLNLWRFCYRTCFVGLTDTARDIFHVIITYNDLNQAGWHGQGM